MTVAKGVSSRDTAPIVLVVESEILVGAHDGSLMDTIAMFRLGIIYRDGFAFHPFMFL